MGWFRSPSPSPYHQIVPYPSLEAIVRGLAKNSQASSNSPNEKLQILFQPHAGRTWPSLFHTIIPKCIKSKSALMRAMRFVLAHSNLAVRSDAAGMLVPSAAWNKRRQCGLHLIRRKDTAALSCQNRAVACMLHATPLYRAPDHGQRTCHPIFPATKVARLSC